MSGRFLRRAWLSGVVAASLASLAGCSKPPPAADEPLKVAAAADLSVAFEEVGAAFEKKTGKKVTFSFGASGLLTKQIKEGAPFDVFAAANVSFVDQLVAAKAAVESSKVLYARGHIVILTPPGSEPVAKVEDLADPRFKKIAIANPETAPYGKAAKQALTKAGVLPAVESRLVFGENVLQTMQFAESGNADAAIVALSLALTAKGKHTNIDEGMHESIDQAMVICEGSKQKAAAADFIAFVGSDEGHAIMKKSGFLLPGEAVTAK
jgi:molybdate transport system substrate-binding protein